MIFTYNTNKLRTDLNEYLKNRAESLRNFSKRIEVDVSMLSRFRNGDYSPGHKVLPKIVEGISGDISDYILDELRTGGKSIDYESLSIDNLNSLIEELIEIRNRKINARLLEIESAKAELCNEIKAYEQLVKGESQ